MKNQKEKIQELLDKKAAHEKPVEVEAQAETSPPETPTAKPGPAFQTVIETLIEPVFWACGSGGRFGHISQVQNGLGIFQHELFAAFLELVLPIVGAEKTAQVKDALTTQAYHPHLPAAELATIKASIARREQELSKLKSKVVES